MTPRQALREATCLLGLEERLFKATTAIRDAFSLIQDTSDEDVLMNQVHDLRARVAGVVHKNPIIRIAHDYAAEHNRKGYQ